MSVGDNFRVVRLKVARGLPSFHCIGRYRTYSMALVGLLDAKRLGYAARIEGMTEEADAALLALTRVGVEHPERVQVARSLPLEMPGGSASHE